MIKFVQFMSPINFPEAPGGTDYWDPVKYAKTACRDEGGGLVLSWSHQGEELELKVYPANIRTVLRVKGGKEQKKP